MRNLNEAQPFIDQIFKSTEELREAIKVSRRGGDGLSAQVKDPAHMVHLLTVAASALHVLAVRADRAEARADEYKWQVRDTCTRAETAERRLAVARAALRSARVALPQPDARSGKFAEIRTEIDAALGDTTEVRHDPA